ncbi:MAG: hypothetical protein ABN502_13270, partial [Gammaproteobacteria bacterium]
CAVFGRDRMSRPKIPLTPRTRSKAAGAKAGCAFFGLPFFAQAKKSDSPQDESFFAATPNRKSKSNVPGSSIPGHRA